MNVIVSDSTKWVPLITLLFWVLGAELNPDVHAIAN
jgi:hypothetical protein